MSIHARFVHVNLVARDWRRLAAFYKSVFGCAPVPPERDLSGGWLDAATGVTSARIQGIHLRLPGSEGNGPTLEIFQYEPVQERVATSVNCPGFGHIAFAVNDIGQAREAVLAAGGHTVGELGVARIPGAGMISFVYLTDPEGNIIELQHRVEE